MLISPNFSSSHPSSCCLSSYYTGSSFYSSTQSTSFRSLRVFVLTVPSAQNALISNFCLDDSFSSFQFQSLPSPLWLMLPQFLWQRFQIVLKTHTLLPEHKAALRLLPSLPCTQTWPYDCFSQWNMNEGSYVTARSVPQNTSQVLLPARCSRQLGPWGWGSHKMVGTQDVGESHATNLNTHSGLLHKKETSHFLSYHILGGRPVISSAYLN